MVTAWCNGDTFLVQSCMLTIESTEKVLPVVKEHLKCRTILMKKLGYLFKCLRHITNNKKMVVGTQGISLTLFTAFEKTATHAAF